MAANPEGIKALVAKWRSQANSALRGSGTWSGDQMADRIIWMADELESLTAVAGDAEAANLGEFVIALLIAGGYVTQAKVDEARKIAISHGPYEMPARQAVEGMVMGRPTDKGLICAPCCDSPAIETDTLQCIRCGTELAVPAAPQAGKGV